MIVDWNGGRTRFLCVIRWLGGGARADAEALVRSLVRLAIDLSSEENWVLDKLEPHLACLLARVRQPMVSQGKELCTEPDEG